MGVSGRPRHVFLVPDFTLRHKGEALCCLCQSFTPSPSPVPPPEIIKEVVTNGDNLTELLRFNTEQLEPNCLNRALEAAVVNDNHFNVGKLIVKGANNFQECLELASNAADHKPHARAMLLLVKAAREGNRSLVLRLFGEGSHNQDTSEFSDEAFKDVQKVVIDGKVSTVVPIEIARRSGNNTVREELLLRTDVKQQDGTVYWHGLRLLMLDVSWLRKIYWVQRLRLARNGFKTLPNEMGTYLKQVRNYIYTHVHVCICAAA